MLDPDEPFFVAPDAAVSDYGQSHIGHYRGPTTRDYIAIQAMKGLLANAPSVRGTVYDIVAIPKVAYELADAMIQASVDYEEKLRGPQ
jgi:hypothetical protein